ncbi:MAG: hypothetical protein H8F28_18675 [Fibrella sp.]|nr:hypothetical protein [Armatimonadota bacterium]
MQYFRPGGNQFVGDCMPFSHCGRFHLYYLLDEGHHQALGGLGGHQWAHTSSVDLLHWTHHPLALPITESWEGSICTGSVIYDKGEFYAFYATRQRDRTQQVRVARSADGVHFVKPTDTVPLLLPPPGYAPIDFRDPFVWRGDDGVFHLLVTANHEAPALFERGGTLLRYWSHDLRHWMPDDAPFLVPGGEPGYKSVPECPDLFHWGEWYYLLFGLGLQTHYRMARSPDSEWLRPPVDTLDTPWNAVIKTASWGDDRRIGVGWIPWRAGETADGAWQWGGNAVFRELVRHEDGTLGTRFVGEMTSYTTPISPSVTVLTLGGTADPETIFLPRHLPQAVVALDDLPSDFRLCVRVVPESGATTFGIGLRGTGNFERSVQLRFYPYQKRVVLGGEATLYNVAGLCEPFDLEIIVQGDIADVCMDNRRCVLGRVGKDGGSRLFFWSEASGVRWEDFRVYTLHATASPPFVG